MLIGDPACAINKGFVHHHCIFIAIDCAIDLAIRRTNADGTTERGLFACNARTLLIISDPARGGITLSTLVCIYVHAHAQQA